MDAYEWLQIYLLRLRIKSSPFWHLAIENTCTLDQYKEVISSMFRDGIVNSGRILVLEQFTRDLCKRWPREAFHAELKIFMKALSRDDDTKTI